MQYRLILSEQTGEVKKDVGENVFLDDLPGNYKVYLFYYPGAMGSQELEDDLRRLGKIAGQNLFVNIGMLDDPNYNMIASHFEIKRLPCIVMTAVDELASPPSSFLSAYVRVDSERLIGTPDKLIETLQKIFNLFMSGNVADAFKEVKKDDRKVLIASFTKVVTDGLAGLWNFIKETDISFSVADGKFELKRH